MAVAFDGVTKVEGTLELVTGVAELMSSNFLQLFHFCDLFSLITRFPYEIITMAGAHCSKYLHNSKSTKQFASL